MCLTIGRLGNILVTFIKVCISTYGTFTYILSIFNDVLSCS